MAERTIPAPPMNPEVQPFFDAAKQGKLLVKQCAGHRGISSFAGRTRRPPATLQRANAL